MEKLTIIFLAVVVVIQLAAIFYKIYKDRPSRTVEFNGVGTPKEEEKGKAFYARALELYDNPPAGLYIPENSKDYRNFLLERSQLHEINK